MFFANTRVDRKETPRAPIIVADLPGMEEEGEGRVLQISGERSRDKEEEKKNDRWYRVERSSGRFRLLENAKVDQAKASIENGILTVTVAEEEVKLVEISG